MTAAGINWGQLRAALSGDLILPGDGILYQRARQVFNARIQRRPAAVARCVDAQDVQRCVQFCAANGVSITPRGGGHGALGYAVGDDQLMIDMSALQRIAPDLRAATVTVGGGAMWGQVDLATYSRGYATPGGGCPTVGAAGLAQGGGFGPIARSHGLTLDCLQCADMVLADGRALTVSADSEPDLFWAIRGGGGGNFGVVTSFTFQMFPIEAMLTAGTLLFEFKYARQALQFYRNWMQSPAADERLTMLALLAFGPDMAPIAAISCLYNGDWQAGAAYIAQIMKDFDAPPTLIPPDLGPMTLNAFGASESTTTFPGYGAYWRSGLLKNEFPDAAIDTIIEWFPQTPLPPTSINPGGKPGRSPDLSFLFIESLGGAIGRVEPTATAFVHRDSLFSLSFIGVYPPGDLVLGEKTRVWSVGFRRAMEPYLSGGVYVNYMQDDLPNWQQAYYGQNFARLRAVKQQYDPGHLFRFPQDVMQD